MKYLRQFGAKLSSADEQRFSASPQFKNGRFENLVTTTMDITLSSLPKILKENFSSNTKKSPEQPIPIAAFEAQSFDSADNKPKFIWYGHSVLLLQLLGKNILIDPMFGDNAAPISPIATKRFSENSLELIDQLPKIDLVIITHDHYDHLDYDSIKKLLPLADKWFVSLGVGRHINKWGVPADQISEFDWWDEVEFENIKMTCTPSRHFSGRGPFDRAKSLWGGWVFQTDDHSIYWSGDGGYGDHFKSISEKFGSFDWAFIECGQYNKYWRPIHMFPDESVQAGLDVNANIIFPVHWGGFSLSPHAWKEPIEQFMEHAQNNSIQAYSPEMGIAINFGEENRCIDWWKDLN
ncbi:MAG: L-ascorbate metabolism protein UlaG (beta-lactamase superfamily) [Flavobacteriales bacterium]|jgi:L-ascorbate metabolism protein UlaG (beta-lactamase superfamily)